jgi:hypothetical protein
LKFRIISQCSRIDDMCQLVDYTPSAFPEGSGPAYNRRMAARRINEPIEPMTLGNMRANGVRSLDVSCRYEGVFIGQDEGRLHYRF